MTDRTIREVCNEAMTILEEASEYGRLIKPEEIVGYFVEIRNILGEDD